MIICIVTPRYPYKDKMEFVFVKKLVDEWAKMGHKCVVLSAFSKTAYFRRRISYRPLKYSYSIGDNVIDVFNPRYYTLGLKMKGISYDLLNETRCIERSIKKINIDFDFIYCHFFESAIISYRYAESFNVPLFVATGESNIPKLNKPFRGFSLESFRSFVKGVIAVSSKNKDEATKRELIDPLKCQVFPNGTDLSIFHPLDKIKCRKKLNISQDLFIITCVGFICERKGQNRLLEAVRKLEYNNIKIIFIGKSAKTETFKLEGEEILFKGGVENYLLPEYLNASDVFCLPTRAEGCCNAIIEALACGIPVISSDRPFNWDVLDDNNSILIDPENIEEISFAIKELYLDVKRRQKLSKGARLKGEGLSIEQRSVSIMDYIKNTIRLCE